MTAGGPPDNVTDLRSRRRYAPDLVSLACRKVASAREQAGLSVAAFAAELGQLLGWMPAPDLVRTWESTVAPPSHVVIACEVVASRTAQAEPADGGDEVASAACDAEAEQSWLLAEPGPQSIESLWDEAAGIARAANRSALQTFGASRRIHSRALMLAEQTHRPAALADLYVIAGPGDSADGVNGVRPQPLGRVGHPGAIGCLLRHARGQRVLAGVDPRPFRAPRQLAQGARHRAQPFPPRPGGRTARDAESPAPLHRRTVLRPAGRPRVCQPCC